MAVTPDGQQSVTQTRSILVESGGDGAMEVKLGHVFAGEAVGAGHPEDERFVEGHTVMGQTPESGMARFG